MSEELEQLKDDLAKLLEAAKIYDARYKGADWKATLGIIESRIARLEAEQADPWRRAKQLVLDWLRIGGKSEVNEVATYCTYLAAERDRLTKRVAELEAANEPPFWPSESEIQAIKPQDEKAIMDAAVELMERLCDKPDPDDPILDPARVLATAETMGWGKVMPDGVVIKPSNAKPYRLKGGDE